MLQLRGASARDRSGGLREGEGVLKLLEPESRILALALQAIDDVDALPVLGDALQETGWMDLRAVVLLQVEERWRRNLVLAGLLPSIWSCPTSPWPRPFLDHKIDAPRSRGSIRRARRRWRNFSAAPTTIFARAVAAVLLFGWWDSSPWPANIALSPSDYLSRLRERIESYVERGYIRDYSLDSVLTLTAQKAGPRGNWIRLQSYKEDP